LNLKVLHVIDSINVAQGGPSVSVPSLAREQARLGHQVTIVCRDYGYLGTMVKPEGVEIRSVPSSRWTKGQGGWGCAFRRLVEEEARKADVVHNHGLWLAANYYARRAASKAGKPLVISPRGMLEDWSLRRAVVRKFVAWQLFERENLRSAKLFHATADSEAEAIKTALRIKMKIKIKEPRIVVAPNGVDVPERIPGREVVEQKFPGLKGKEWVLFMSRIHPKKGIDLLLQAWKEQMTARGQVEGGRREVMLVIAGADTQGYGKEVKRMIREKGLGETVLMTGHVDGELREALLGNSMFLVLPSFSENFGLVIAESLARGRPVITTTGTPWNELKEWGAGWWVEPKQESVSRTLGEALAKSDPELNQMGARGRREVEKKFSWKAAAEKVVDAYKELVDSR
jgi:glycosyltransferase involved in cell wall biosynthesis